MSYLVAGVGSIQLFDPSSNALILTSKTLTDEGINFGSTAEEARGGMGNALLGKSRTMVCRLSSSLRKN